MILSIYLYNIIFLFREPFLFIFFVCSLFCIVFIILLYVMYSNFTKYTYKYFLFIILQFIYLLNN